MLVGCNRCLAAGVCHCNISGDVVWLKDAEIRLGGFEDSEICKTGQHISTRAGRIQYLAPEVFVGHTALPVDIWAFAAVFYRLLSGHFPFGGESGEMKLIFSGCKSACQIMDCSAE